MCNTEKLDMFEFDKMLIPKSYSQEDTEILKRLTKKYRPLCDFCGQRCGIVWFQHRRSLSAKEITKIMKNVNLKNPPLSSTEYEIILCIKCYSDGNFPIILSSNDFNKVTINEKLVEGKSKKKNRDPPELQAESEWTQDEVSLLLDLVLKMGDKWSEIATHFKNRTEEEVVMCFLNLPLKQISRLKIDMEPEDFVKENFDELCNNFSSTIAQTVFFS
jgi:SWI/SNF related-matrix-associated actin-dependent regulator of chromatin subfamily C